MRRPPVEHPAHVGLVDTHAERARGDDDRRAVGEEGAQHLTPSRRPEARVIRSRPHAHPQQGTCDQLGQAAGGCVHDRASVDAPEQLADAGEPLTVVPHLLYCEPEVRSIERRHHHLRVRHPQHPKDLGAGGGRGAPCERDCDWITEQIAMPVEPAIQGAEFIAPLDDAVRFVHGEQRHRPAGSRQLSHQAVQPLGRTIEQCQSSRERRVEDRATLVPREQAVEERRRNAPSPQGAHLILHEREQRRYDEREAAGHECRQLVAE